MACLRALLLAIFFSAAPASADPSVQVWVGLTDDAYPSIKSKLSQHMTSVTDISPFGILSVHPSRDGRIVVDETQASRAQALGETLGLGVWPLLSGSLEDLRGLMKRPAMIADAVALAQTHGWRGYNLDFELNAGPLDAARTTLSGTSAGSTSGLKRCTTRRRPSRANHGWVCKLTSAAATIRSRLTIAE